MYARRALSSVAREILFNERISFAKATVEREGFCVIDDVLDESIAANLREEIILSRELMTQNHTHVVAKETLLYPKSGIFELDFSMHQDVTNRMKTCTSLSKSKLLMECMLKNTASSPEIPCAIDRDGSFQTLKLQFNAGNGSCFPIHFDSDPMVNSKKFTAIIYLNPGWEQLHGGELRLYVSRDTTVDVKPVHNRLVLFNSTDMPHRVLPYHGPGRICCTIWIYDSPEKHAVTLKKIQEQRQYAKVLFKEIKQRNSPSKQQQLKQHLLELSEIRKPYLKLMHREEWRQSILESHKAGPSRDSLISSFDDDIQTTAMVMQCLM